MKADSWRMWPPTEPLVRSRMEVISIIGSELRNRRGCRIRPSSQLAWRFAMVRNALLGACAAVVFVWAFGSAGPAAAPTTGPIKLAQHPDYHAGKITFSY